MIFLFLRLLLISILAMFPPILLDVANRLNGEFRPAIWWRDNHIRLSLAGLFILIMISLAFLAPDGMIEGFSLAGLKEPSGAVSLGLMTTGSFLLLMSKAKSPK